MLIIFSFFFFFKFEFTIFPPGLFCKWSDILLKNILAKNSD